MRQLSQQKHRQTNNKPTTFIETEFIPLEKKGPVRIEPKTFAVPGILVTSRPCVPETQRNMNIKWSKPIFLFLILTILWTKLFTGKSLVPYCNTLAYRQGKLQENQKTTSSLIFHITRLNQKNCIYDENCCLNEKTSRCGKYADKT